MRCVCVRARGILTNFHRSEWANAIRPGGRRAVESSVDDANFVYYSETSTRSPPSSPLHPFPSSGTCKEEVGAVGARNPGEKQLGSAAP